MCHHKSLNIAIVDQMSRLGQSSKWAKLCILHRMQYSLQLKLQENRNTSKQDFRSGWSASLTTNRFHFTSYKDGFSMRFNCLGDRIWYQTSWHIVDTNLGHDTNWGELDYIEFNYISLNFSPNLGPFLFRDRKSLLWIIGVHLRESSSSLWSTGLWCSRRDSTQLLHPSWMFVFNCFHEIDIDWLILTGHACTSLKHRLLAVEQRNYWRNLTNQTMSHEEWRIKQIQEFLGVTLSAQKW